MDSETQYTVAKGPALKQLQLHDMYTCHNVTRRLQMQVAVQRGRRRGTHTLWTHAEANDHGLDRADDGSLVVDG